MGYETRLHIGMVMDKMEHEDSSYFLEYAHVDLSKCCMDFHNFISEGMRGHTFPEVHWSRQFKINQEKTLETLRKEKQPISQSTNINLEDVVAQVSDCAEGWETKISEDSYGDVLVAVPISVVYKALQKTIAKQILEDDHYYPYRRYTMAFALIENMMKGWTDNDGQCELSVVLYGY